MFDVDTYIETENILTCVTCGQFPPSAGFKSCCRGCANDSISGCTCNCSGIRPIGSRSGIRPIGPPGSCFMCTLPATSTGGVCCLGCLNGRCDCPGGTNTTLDTSSSCLSCHNATAGYRGQCFACNNRKRPRPIDLWDYGTEGDVVQGFSSEQETCVICLCDLEFGSRSFRLRCMHHFHSKCIEKHIENATNRHVPVNCPICKMAMIAEHN